MILYRILLTTVFLFCNANPLSFKCKISLETEYQKPSEQIFAFDKTRGVLSDESLGRLFIEKNELFLQPPSMDAFSISSTSLEMLNTELSAVFGFITSTGNLQFLIGNVNGTVMLINKDGKLLISHKIASLDGYHHKVIRFHQIGPQFFCVVTKMEKIIIMEPCDLYGWQHYCLTQVCLNFIEFGCQGKGLCQESIILPIKKKDSITFRKKQICVKPAKNSDYVKITVHNHD